MMRRRIFVFTLGFYTLYIYLSIFKGLRETFVTLDTVDSDLASSQHVRIAKSHGTRQSQFKRHLAEINIPKSYAKVEDFKPQAVATTCLQRKHKDANCMRLRMGDVKYISSVKDMEVSPVDDDCTLDRLVKDCPRFITAHGYNQFPVTAEEEAFPIAFAIKMYRSPKQAEQLLRTIYRPQNAYCIYVDKKATDNVFNTMEFIAGCFKNVFIIKDRENIVYSSFAQVRSEMDCMRKLLDSSVNWKYYINMAAQEFPLKTNLEMVKILRYMGGVNDIETYDHPPYQTWRVTTRYVVMGNSLAEVGHKPEFKYDIQLSKGSQYGMFSRDFVKFVLTDGVARDVINWLNDTYSPEENVWATLNTLPWAPGGYSIEVRHLLNTFMSRATILARDTRRCSGKYLRGVCVFGLGDLAWLTRTPAIIANKFDTEDLDPTVLDCLEEWYRQKTLDPQRHSLQWGFYRHLPHVKYYNSLSAFDKSKEKRATMKANWLKNHVKNVARSTSGN